MSQLDLYDDLDAEDLEQLGDSEDYWSLEDDSEDDEADELALGTVVGGALGAGLGGAATQGLYDLSAWGLGKIGEKTGSTTLSNWSKWLKDTTRARDFATNVGAGAGGVIGAAAGTVSPTPEDADPFEPEYSAEDIDQMEALGEEAVDGIPEDAVIAVDELIGRSFGIMRASPKMQPIMLALRGQVRQIIARARRDPRFRVPARLAPLALRRTSALLMRMVAAKRPVGPKMAVEVFSRVLGGLLRSQNTTAKAAHAAQTRARRHRARHGTPAPAAAMPHPAAVRARAMAQRQAMLRR